MNIEDETFPGLRVARRASDLERLRVLTQATDLAAVRMRGGRRFGARASVVMGAASVVIVGGGIATAATLQHLAAKSATVTNYGRCYFEVSSETSDNFPGSFAISATSSEGWTPPLVENLLADCAASWRAGAMQNSSGTDPNTNGTYPVPELTACVLPDGEAAVYPGPASVCDTLGLAPLSS